MPYALLALGPSLQRLKCGGATTSPTNLQPGGSTLDTTRKSAQGWVLVRYMSTCVASGWMGRVGVGFRRLGSWVRVRVHAEWKHLAQGSWGRAATRSSMLARTSIRSAREWLGLASAPCRLDCG